MGVPGAPKVEVLTAALDRHKDRPDAVIAVPGIRRKEGMTTLDGFFGVCGSWKTRDWIQNFVEVWPWGGVKFPVILKAVKA